MTADSAHASVKVKRGAQLQREQEKEARKLSKQAAATSTARRLPQSAADSRQNCCAGGLTAFHRAAAIARVRTGVDVSKWPLEQVQCKGA